MYSNFGENALSHYIRGETIGKKWIIQVRAPMDMSPNA
jgi:hypothetical protein